jgi:hypothetical protein
MAVGANQDSPPKARNCVLEGAELLLICGHEPPLYSACSNRWTGVVCRNPRADGFLGGKNYVTGGADGHWHNSNDDKIVTFGKKVEQMPARGGSLFRSQRVNRVNRARKRQAGGKGTDTA